MIALVVKKELMAVRRDGKLVTLGVAVFVVLAGLLLMALAEHRQLAQEKAVVGQGIQQQWENQGVRSPHGAAHFGIYVFSPDSLLTAIDPGISPYTGETIWVEPHKRNMARFNPAADASPSSRLGQMAPAFILYALMPLLIVALAFNAISYEREQGTLRMLHSLGVSGAHLLTGKLLGLLLVFTLVLMPSVLLALGLVSLQAVGMSADVVIRTLLLSGAYLFYYALLIALALALSAFFRTSRGALFALVGLWLVFVLVAPRAGSALADQWVSLPTSTGFWTAINNDIAEGMAGDGDARARAAQIEQEILAEYGVRSIDELPLGYGALSRMARDSYTDRVHAVHFGDLWQRYAQQEVVMRTAALLSPAIAMRSLSMKLSGSDLAHRQHFEQATETYRQYFNTFIDTWEANRVYGTERFDEEIDELLRTVEPFQYVAPGPAFALRSAAPDMLLLLLWGMLAAVALRFAVRRLAP